MSVSKLLATTVIAFAVAAPAAQAAIFTGTFDVTANTSDPGLVVQVAPDNGSINADLEVGESTSVHLFDIWTTETDVSGVDQVAKPISVEFDFSHPDTANTLGGETDGVRKFFGVVQYGSLEWDNPVVFNFGQGGTGEFEISLTEGKFNGGLFGLNEGPGKGLKVYASVSYNVAPVPLPAAGFVLLGALAAAGVAYRRRAAA